MSKELYINGKRIELKKENVIAMTFQVNDIAELKDRQADLSNTINIELTGNNKRILANPDHVNSISKVPYRLNETKYVQNGIEVVPNGVSIVRGSTENKFSELAILSGIYDFFSRLQDKTLKDLDLSDFDFKALPEFAANSIGNTEGVIYPVLFTGRVDKMLTGSTIDIRDQVPCFFLHTLIDKIFQEAGFNRSGNIFKDSFYRSLVLPLLGKVEHSEKWIKDRSSKVGFDVSDGKSSHFTIGIPFIDSLSGNDVTPMTHYELREMDISIITFFKDSPMITSNGEVVLDLNDGIKDNYSISAWTYTADTAMIAEIDLNIVTTIKVFATNIEFKYYVLKNGIVVRQESDPGIYVDHSEKIFKLTPLKLNLLPNDKVTWAWELHNNTGIGTYSFYVDKRKTWASVTPTKDIAVGSDLAISDLIMDMPQISLVKAWAQMFGIIFQANNITNTMRCVQFKEIPRNKTVDWSSKLDLSREIEIKYRFDKYGQKNIMKYAEAEEGERTEIGDSFFVIDDTTLEKKVDLFEIPFQASDSKRIFGDVDTAWIPLYSNDLQEGDSEFANNWATNKIGNRILALKYVNKAITYTDGVNTPIAAPLIRVPVAYFVDNLQPRNLSFENSLIKDNYQELIRCLDRCKIVRAYFNLDELDIQNLDFFNPIYVEYFGLQFYLNKVEEFMENKSTLCELVKLNG